MSTPDGIIELIIENHDEHHSVLSLEVVCEMDAAYDLKDRIKKVLDEWMTDNGIMIKDGVGPDGCNYGGKPN